MAIYSVFSRFSGIHGEVFIVTFTRIQDKIKKSSILGKPLKSSSFCYADDQNRTGDPRTTNAVHYRLCYISTPNYCITKNILFQSEFFAVPDFLLSLSLYSKSHILVSTQELPFPGSEAFN